MFTRPSYIKNTGKVSYTYQDSGVYGRYINKCRVAAWAIAMRRYVLPTEHILDVGCSYGSWAGNWKELGFQRLLGAEPNAEAAHRAKETFDQVAVCYSFELSKHFPRCAVIAANGVIVHILEKSEEKRFLSDLGGNLSAGGFLLFSVVNAQHYLSPVGRKPWRGRDACTRYLKDHDEFARKAGLRVIDRIGTFIDPWFCPELEFINKSNDLKDDWQIYESLLGFSSAIRERSLSPFGEVLYVTQRVA